MANLLYSRMMYGGYDWTYILILIGFVFALIAQFGVQGTFKKYDKVLSARNITGADAARRILDANGLQHIRIEHINGNLTDHFSPKENVIRLSDATYNSTSVAAIGVAAHECGHAVQHKVGYAPIRVRNGIVPFVNICNRLSLPIFIIGILLGYTSIAYAGAILFGGVVLFQLVTLPTEVNASRRAMQTLEGMYILENEELKGARKVLRAAAMTYVAALVSTSLQFLRLLLIVMGRGRRR